MNTDPSDPDDICYTHHGGNPESNAANLETNKHKDRSAILRLLDQHGRLTCDEIEVYLQMRHQTASARCSELLRDETIERTGEKRETRSGSKAAVLRIRVEPRAAVAVNFNSRDCEQTDLWELL